MHTHGYMYTHIHTYTRIHRSVGIHTCGLGDASRTHSIENTFYREHILSHVVWGMPVAGEPDHVFFKLVPDAVGCEHGVDPLMHFQGSCTISKETYE